MTLSLMNWTGVDIARFGLQPMCIKHRVHEHQLFTDAALARLIEQSDRENYYVNTMNTAAHDTRSRREGEVRGISGAAALEAVAKGKLWIMLLHPEKVEPGYRDLVQQLYDEIGRHVPGFRAFNQKLSILISSPGIQVYYHCDVPGQTLWQVRGRKRVYVYPNQPPYLDQPSLERIVLGEAHEISLPYDEKFDQAASVYDIEPGDMLHWPLNAPHRIVNADCLNVSFTTEHFSPDIKRSFVVNYANGVLRRRLGWRRLSQSIEGPGYWAKLAVAGAYRYSGLPKKRRQRFKVDFTVDPAAPDCVRTIPAYEFRK